MSAVTVQEIVEALHNTVGSPERDEAIALADRIKKNGIAQPDGMVLVPKEPVAYWRMFHGTDAGVFANTKGVQEEMTTEPFASEYEYIPLYAIRAAMEVK